MFTGIVERMGAVAAVRSTAAGLRLVVDPRGWEHRPSLGDSIAVNGCCLTVAEAPKADGLLAFDAVPETLSKTTLGGLGVGRLVNLEHAATAGTLLGGHIVQGHVDGVGTVERNGSGAPNAGSGPTGGAEGWTLRIRLGRGLMEYMVPKGSVAIDGVSLTLARLDVVGSAIEIALIPTTLAKTGLGGLKPGDGVNIEADMMAKTVVHYLEHFLKVRESSE